MKSNQKQAGLDFVTPFVEIFHELLMMIFDVMKMTIVMIYKKITKKDPPLKKIEIDNLSIKKSTDNPLAIGVDTASKKEISLDDINFARHSFIVGASGFGKTNLISVLQEHSLKNGRPIIFFDPKGDCEAMTTFKNLCEQYNKTCLIFSEHYEQSITMNPLLEGSINQVADRLMRAFTWSEQYYKDMAYRALFKTLKYLEKQGKDFTLKEIHEHLIGESNQKDLAGLVSKVESMLESDFGKYLNGTREDYTISKVRKEGACLYIGLSTQGYGETAQSIGKLFLEELLYNSYNTLKNLSPFSSKPDPISVYFDEFGAIVTPQFIELQNKCRGAGMELTMAVQSHFDIDRVDPALTCQIIENASNHFIMKQRLGQGSEFLSKNLGTIIAKKKTVATEDGEHLGKGTERDGHELIVHPDIIKNLKVGQCVLLRHDPVRINLINVRYRKPLLEKKIEYKASFNI